ncbi:hypothetical protein ScPMuIL_003576 [Solemya velum]
MVIPPSKAFSDLTLCVLLLGCTYCTPVARISELRRSIKENYTHVEPFLLTDSATRVNVSLGLMALTHFSEVDGELSSLVYLELQWHDPQIQWDPIDYAGRQNITLFPHEIWTPILIVVNQIDTLKGIGKDIIGGQTFKVRAYYTGEMVWVPGVALTTTCSVDVTYFPEDEQTCAIGMHPWGYTIDEIEFVCAEESVDFEYYSSNGEWDIMDSSCSEDHFTFKMKRKSVYYYLNIILPVFFLGILNAFVFLIPANSGETFSFSVTIFLSLMVYLTIVGQQLPRTSDHVSLLSYYLIVDVIYSSCIIIVSIAIQRLQNARDNATPICPCCPRFSSDEAKNDNNGQLLSEKNTRKLPLAGKCWSSNGTVSIPLSAGLTLCMLLLGYGDCVPVTQIAELRKSIKENYTHVEPFLLTDSATRINVSLGLMALTQFSEVDGTLSSLVHITLQWHDPQIQWNPNDYAGRQNITFFPQELWTPILTVVNQVDILEGIGKGFIGRETFKVRADYTGNMVWIPGVALTTACSVDVTYFPEDKQTCIIEMFPWAYRADEIELVCAEEAVMFEYYSSNGEWDIMDISCFESDFVLKIKRKPVYYFLNIILPVFILGILNAFVFLIPANSGETFSFSVTIFLSLIVYLTIVGQQLPRTSDHVSLLSCYLIADVIYSSCIIIMVIAIQRLHNARVNAKPICPSCTRCSPDEATKNRSEQILTETNTRKLRLAGKCNRCVDNLIILVVVSGGLAIP